MAQVMAKSTGVMLLSQFTTTVLLMIWIAEVL